MKKTIKLSLGFCTLLLLLAMGLKAQQDTSRYFKIQGYGEIYLIPKNNYTKNFSFDGIRFIDIRKATADELEKIENWKKIAPRVLRTVRLGNSKIKTLEVDSPQYFKSNGTRLIDMRKARPNELKEVEAYWRMNGLVNKEHFWRNEHPKPSRNRFWKSLGFRVKPGDKAEVYQGKDWQWGTLRKDAMLIDGEASAEIIDAWITPETAKNYRYRILQNDKKELVGWTTPSVFVKTQGSPSYSYCLLAKIPFQANQFIQVEIYNINDYKDRDAFMLNWQKPVKFKYNASLEYVKKYGINGYRDLFPKKSFRLSDSLLRLVFEAGSISRFYAYQVYLKQTVNGKTEKRDMGEVDGTYFLYKDFWNKPGNYELSFVPKLVRPGGWTSYGLTDKTTVFKFTVLPPVANGKWLTNRQMLILGMCVGLLFVVVLLASITYVKRKGRKKIAKERQQKELANTQLETVRAQLNPHFMFNALAGIQSLMNQQQTAAANDYLAKFARLTRNVLNNEQMVSLDDEISLLDDYLQMEQLRFGFSFKINVANQLDVANTEIPAMLLQPFVENAIKHGVAHKGKEGQVLIGFMEQGNDLKITIADNGMGFSTDEEYTGLGLRLSKKRISLLNEVYSGAPLLLEMESGAKGSKITIVLTQWL